MQCYKKTNKITIIYPSFFIIIYNFAKLFLVSNNLTVKKMTT